LDLHAKIVVKNNNLLIIQAVDFFSLVLTFQWFLNSSKPESLILATKTSASAKHVPAAVG